MHELMLATGETANLAIADGGQVVFISQVETHEPIRAFFRRDARADPRQRHRQGAARPTGRRRRWRGSCASRGCAAFTPRTITDPARLAEELARIRARGWAVDDEERTEGMRCIAAPIFNEFREATAGVSISGPTVRMARSGNAELGALVRAAADRITRAIGGTAP